MKRITGRRAVCWGLGAVLGIAVIGTALARWPALGKEWGEWTHYDANGNAIGGGRIECDGTLLTWGEPGSPSGLVLHPCNP